MSEEMHMRQFDRKRSKGSMACLSKLSILKKSHKSKHSLRTCSSMSSASISCSRSANKTSKKHKKKKEKRSSKSSKKTKVQTKLDRYKILAKPSSNKPKNSVSTILFNRVCVYLRYDI